MLHDSALDSSDFDAGHSADSGSVLCLDADLSDTNAESFSLTAVVQTDTSSDARELLQSEDRVPFQRFALGMERLLEDVLSEVPSLSEEVAHEYGPDLITVLRNDVDSPKMKEPSFFNVLVARVVAFLFRKRAAEFAKGTDSRTLTPTEARERISEVLHLTFKSHGKWLEEYVTSQHLWDQAA